MRLQLVLQTGGGRAISKVVALVFDAADHSRRPAMVVKVARVPEAANSLAQEASALRTLNGIPAVPERVPRLLFFISRGEFLAVGQTALPGLPVEQELTRGGYVQLATTATEWLSAFALASLAPRTPADLATIVRRFEMDYGGIIGPHMATLVTRHLTPLEMLPGVTEHRDFSPWNVFIDQRGRLSVLDWESSVSRGTPGLDLIYFLTHLALSSPGRFRSFFRRPSYTAAWDPATAVGRINHQCVERYARQVGFDASVLPSLRTLTWLVHTQSEYRQIAADTSGSPTATALRRGFFLGLLEKELAALPFGATP